MSRRALIEAFKFLSVCDLFSSVVFVASAWKFTAYLEDVLLFFLDNDEIEGDLNHYERLKRQILNSYPRYLISLGCGNIIVWDTHTNTRNIERHPVFDSCSQYALESRHTAIITGGTKSPRISARVHLATWELTGLGDLLEDRKWHGTVAFDNHVYVCGGDGSRGYLKSAEKLDGLHWKRIADMTIERGGPALCIYNKKMYAFGGANKGRYLTSIEYYDGLVWALAGIELPSSKHFSSVAQHNGCLVLAEGHNSTIKHFVHVLRPGSETWEEVYKMGADYVASSAIAVKKGKVYFFNNSLDHVVIEVKL